VRWGLIVILAIVVPIGTSTIVEAPAALRIIATSLILIAYFILQELLREWWLR
jgi:hypothetical protein